MEGGGLIKTEEQNGRMGPIGILLCGIVILAAVFAGYKLAGRYSEKILGKQAETGTPGAKNGDGADGSSSGDNYKSALNMTPVNLVMSVNSETGRIETVMIEILRAAENKLDYIRIASEVSYTMSSSLYGELIVDNPELPQTVTLSELYRYYHNDKAYDAARRIVSELVNFNIIYYTAVPDNDFAEFFNIRDTSDGMRAGYRLTRDEAAGSAYGTPGSVKGAVSTALQNAVTNWSAADRLRYLDSYDALTSDAVTFTDSPVIELNETCEPDTAGTGAILYKILY